MTSLDSRAGAVRRLRAALERVTGALVACDIQALLDTEAALAGALDDLSRAAPIDAAGSASLREEIAGARTALDGARRTGAAVSDVIDGCVAAWGLACGYDRGGATTVRAPRPAGVDRTV